MKKFIVSLVLLIALLFASPLLVCAQDGTDGTPPIGDETDVPFDKGVVLLVTAGVAYGMIRYFEDKRKKETGQEQDSDTEEWEHRKRV